MIIEKTKLFIKYFWKNYFMVSTKTESSTTVDNIDHYNIDNIKKC